MERPYDVKKNEIFKKIQNFYSLNPQKDGGFECGPPAPIFRTPCNFYEHVRQTCYENHLQTARKKLNFSFTKKKKIYHKCF